MKYKDAKADLAVIKQHLEEDSIKIVALEDNVCVEEEEEDTEESNAEERGESYQDREDSP
jgi:hypothetical protein